jgi:hypothetical protein
MNDEYHWVQKQNLKKFEGKWIAVINKRIVGSGVYVDDVVREVKKKTKETPFLIKVPTEDYLSEEHMKKQQKSGNDSEKWLLVDIHRKVIYSSENIADVIEEGRKYKLYEVSIEKKLTPGTCFFSENATNTPSFRRK